MIFLLFNINYSCVIRSLFHSNLRTVAKAKGVEDSKLHGAKRKEENYSYKLRTSYKTILYSKYCEPIKRNDQSGGNGKLMRPKKRDNSINSGLK